METTKKMFQKIINNNDITSFKPKGEYIIWVEYNDDGTIDVYSTDSVFWANFFTVE